MTAATQSVHTILAAPQDRTGAERVETACQSTGLSEVTREASSRGVRASVTGRIAHALGLDALPVADREFLQANTERVQHLAESVSQIFRAFERSGVRAVVLEGGGAFLHAGAPAGEFDAGDFDILVPPSDLDAAVRCAGERWFERQSTREGLGAGTELEKVQGHFRLRLNLSPVAYDRPLSPLHHADRSENWLARTIACSAYPDIRLLRLEDAVVQACGHASAHSFVRSPGLRLHLDIDRLVRSACVNWEAVREEAALAETKVRTFTALKMGRATLDTPVPDAALENLRPRTVPAWLMRQTLARHDLSAARPRALGLLASLWVELLADDRGPVRGSVDLIAPPRAWLANYYGGEQDAYASLLGKRARAGWELLFRRG